MTYEYLCTKCQHQWELEQKITEEAVKICPQCQQDSAQRLISAGLGFILTGGGWAAEGYK